MRWFAALLLGILLASQAGTALSQPAPSVLEQAAALLRAGKAAQAWSLLAPLEPEHAGERDFDLQLALAALESGRANRATFILERIVAVDPDDLAARMAMGRALFALGDYERAQREFDYVMQASPPAQVRAAAASYLERMGEPRPAPAAAASAYAELTLGHDTNVTTASAVGSVFIPSLGTEFVPEGIFTRQGDRFAGVAAGMKLEVPVSESYALLAGGDVGRRWHSSLDRLDWQEAEVHLGVRRRLGARAELDLLGRHNEYELDGARYRTLQSASAEWRRLLGERARVSLSAHGTRIRYLQQDLGSSSSDLLGLGANAVYLLDAASRTLAFGGVFVGHDNAVAGRADGDRRLYGVSGALQRRVLARVDAYASLALLHSDYQDANPDFGLVRKDRQRDFALGLWWDLGGGWSLRPQLAYTRHRSNLELNDYRRTETSLSLRRLWE